MSFSSLAAGLLSEAVEAGRGAAAAVGDEISRTGGDDAGLVSLFFGLLGENGSSSSSSIPPPFVAGVVVCDTASGLFARNISSISSVLLVLFVLVFFDF